MSNENKSGGIVGFIFVCILLVAAFILGAIFNQPVVEYIGYEYYKEKTEEADLTFGEAQMRGNKSHLASNITSMQYTLYVSDAKAREVAGSEKMRYGVEKLALTDYVTMQQEGVSVLSYLYEKHANGTLSATQESTPVRRVCADGVIRNVIIEKNDPLFWTWGNLNTRVIPLFYVLDERGESPVFELADYGGREYGDKTVSPSLVYLASLYCCQMGNLGVPYNTQLYNVCLSVIDKGVAQAKGVAEADYLPNSHGVVAIDNTQVLTMKVGEQKALPVTMTPNIDIAVVYCGDGDYTGGYTIDVNGKVTALAVGSYTCQIRTVYGYLNYSIEVVE